MRAVVMDPDPRVAEVATPELGVGEARIRVHVAALTGLDRDVVSGRVPFQGTPGTSFVGTVEAVDGAEHRGLIGKRVVSHGSYGCAECDVCRAGAHYRCADRARPGFSVASGGHADQVLLPARALVPVPASMDDEAAALVPLVASVFSSIPRAELPTWTNVLVIGDGGIGLLAAMAHAAAGYTVTVRGKHGDRFDLLRKHNIHFNLVTDEAEVSGSRPGRFGPALVSYPYVVEATGRPSGWDAALSLASVGGTVLLLSSCADGTPRPLQAVQDKNLRVVGLREGPLEPALSIVAQGWLDPTEVVTSRHDLSDAPDAYRRSESPKEWISLLRMTPSAPA